MKIIALIVLSFNIVFGHSQTPSKFGGSDNRLDSITTKQIKVVPITVQNLNSFPQQYYIEVNGKNIGKTELLEYNQSRKLNVPISINQPNQLEVHKVCTVSIAQSKDELFNTKICTKAYLYWVKN